MSEITKSTTLAEVLEIPGAEQVLAKHRVPCLTCPMAQVEMKTLTLGDICGMYGIDLDKLLKGLCELDKKMTG